MGNSSLVAELFWLQIAALVPSGGPSTFFTHIENGGVRIFSCRITSKINLKTVHTTIKLPVEPAYDFMKGSYFFIRILIMASFCNVPRRPAHMTTSSMSTMHPGGTQGWQNAAAIPPTSPIWTGLLTPAYCSPPVGPMSCSALMHPQENR